MILPGVKIHSFDYRFPGSLTGLRYTVSPGFAVEGLDVWPPLTSDVCSLDITTLEVQSGGGKSTLARLLYAFLRRDVGAGGAFTWNAPEPKEAEVSMIPQRTATVLHWRVKDLLPQNSLFAADILPDYSQDGFSKRRLSELSGGQTARVFLASTLERISLCRKGIAYLILDEAFEGIDAAMGNQILQAISTRWGATENCPALRVLLISHFDSDQFLRGIPSRRLKLDPGSRVDVTGGADVISMQEVIVDAI